MKAVATITFENDEGDQVSYTAVKEFERYANIWFLSAAVEAIQKVCDDAPAYTEGTVCSCKDAMKGGPRHLTDCPAYTN